MHVTKTCFRMSGLGHSSSPIKLESPDEGFGDLNVADYMNGNNSFTSPLRLSQPNSPFVVGGMYDKEIGL